MPRGDELVQSFSYIEKMTNSSGADLLWSKKKVHIKQERQCDEDDQDIKSRDDLAFISGSRLIFFWFALQFYQNDLLPHCGANNLSVPIPTTSDNGRKRSILRLRLVVIEAGPRCGAGDRLSTLVENHPSRCQRDGHCDQ